MHAPKTVHSCFTFSIDQGCLQHSSLDIHWPGQNPGRTQKGNLLSLDVGRRVEPNMYTCQQKNQKGPPKAGPPQTQRKPKRRRERDQFLSTTTAPVIINISACAKSRQQTELWRGKWRRHFATGHPHPPNDGPSRQRIKTAGS